MRVLIACEYSGVVREAFRAKGHDAWSCDLLPAEDGSPFHFQGNIFDFLWETGADWDLMIAHPPCTYLCNSGVRWLYHPENSVELMWDPYLNKSEYSSGGYIKVMWPHEDVEERWSSMCDASEFFCDLWNEDNIPKIAIENPTPHKYANLPPYSQAVQPYMFGDDASKRTCLWLKNLPPLSIPPEDTWAQPRIVNGKRRWDNQTDSGQNKLGPSPTRGLDRAKTYPGIAKAMADAWG